MKNKVSFKLGQPVVIAQSDPLLKEKDNWGPFQFPEIERMADGRLHTTYHIRKDSALAYGRSKGHAVSADNGRTWTPIDEREVCGGLLLQNGDRLRLKALPAIDEAEVHIQGEPDDIVISYRIVHNVYESKRLPAQSNRWALERLRAGESEWHIEMKEIDIPFAARYSNGEGVFPFNMFWRLRQEPDGRVWALAYPFFYNGEKPAKVRPLFCVSEDQGHTFQYLSDIPHILNPEVDPLCELRGGYGEPDVTFMPDGSVLCLLRTTDGHGIGPSLICHSYDRGAHWTTPEYFDDNGVWPALLTLKNGITLASYGRPGLFLRATKDASGKEWDERVDIVPKGEYQNDTCSYSDMIALDDNTAYLVYSDFNYPNKDGIPVKSIMGIEIKARESI